MNKGLLGKVSLFSLFFLSLIVILAFFIIPIFALSFTASVTPTILEPGSVSALVNFTINNIGTDANITQVNVTLPSDNVYEEWYVAGTPNNSTTASNTNFSYGDHWASWSNTTAEGFVANESTQYFSFRVATPGFNGIYNLNVSTLDTSGAYNSTNVSITLTDSIPPTLSNNTTTSPANYSATTLSFLNVSWQDNVGISAVLIEGDWSGSPYNYTVSGTYPDYYYSEILPAGTWYWKSYANDSSNLWSTSGVLNFTIGKAAVPLTLSNNVSWSGNYPFSTNVTCSACPDQISGTCKLYRNDSEVSGLSESALLDVDAYNYICNTTGNANYSANSTSNTLTISKGTPNVGAFIDGIDDNKTITYPTSVTIKGNSSSQFPPIFSLSVYNVTNTSQIFQNSSNNPATLTLTLGNETWRVEYSTSGNGNWNSAVNNTLYLIVNKGALSGSITGSDVAYPNSVNVQPSKTSTGDADVNYTFWRNITLVNSSLGSAPGADTSILAAGTYVYILNSTGGANYSLNSSMATKTITVSQGDPTSTMNISINGTSADSTLIYPNATNVTGWSTITDQSSLTFNFYGNTTGNTTFISNSTSVPYNISDQNFFGVNTYTYILNTSGNANYTSGNVTRILTISKGTPTLVITGFGTVTYPFSATVVCTATSQNSEVTAFLYRNGTNVSSTTETVSSSTTVVYNYTCNSSATANYTAGQATSQTLTLNAAASSSNTGGSIGGISTTGMITYINLAVGKANITANYLTTSGKLIANIAKYQDVAIRGINITVVNNVANIKVMISKLPSLPSTVPYDINGKVYHYISVGELNFTDADIKSVNISFAVNKTWLTNNSIDASNITMYRWANNKWNDLNAVKVSDDGKEVFFSVSSPGLSVLIIGTKGGAPAVTETPVTCTESWQCTAWSACANSKQTRTCTDVNSCGTTTSKPSESQNCTVSKGETTVPSPTPDTTSILTTIIIISVAIIACVFIFLERAKISFYLVKITKRNNKKTSYLESLARKVNKVEEEEEEKLNVNVE